MNIPEGDMPGQIKRARLTQGKPKLSLELSDPSALAKKASISVDGLPAGNYKLSHGKSSRRVTVNGTLMYRCADGGRTSN